MTLLDFEASHARSYNELIEVVKNNLLLGDWCVLCMAMLGFSQLSAVLPPSGAHSDLALADAQGR